MSRAKLAGPHVSGSEAWADYWRALLVASGEYGPAPMQRQVVLAERRRQRDADLERRRAA